MAPPTFFPHANAVEHRKPDVIVNSRYFENVKRFIAQNVIFDWKIIFTLKIHRDENFDTRSHVDMFWFLGQKLP